MKKISRILSSILSICLLMSVCSIGTVSAAEVSYPDSLFQTPDAVEVTELSYGEAGTQVSGVNVKNVKAILIDGAEYKGQKTQVFAYWGMPDNVEAGKKVPGVVLVHGGGGTAYADWVQRWNDRGYAAIAVYWVGGNDPAVPASYNWVKGPLQVGCFDDIGEKTEDQWMYHAISTSIVANSFLRNQEGVDAEKIGICGVSWGGIISSYAIGVDNRYAFAVPIYGAGYIKDSKAHIGSQMTEAKNIWDPANVLKNAKVPTLFVNGDSDPWFSVNIQASSTKDVEGSKLSIINGLDHGHQLAFNVEEPYSFADSIVKSGTALATITENSFDKKEDETSGCVKYQTASPISKATLYYTKYGIVYSSSTTFAYPWQRQELEISTAGEVNFVIPAGTVGYYVAIKDELGRTIATPYTEVPGGASGTVTETNEGFVKRNVKEKVLMSWTGEDTIPDTNKTNFSNIAEIKEFQGEKVINLRTTTAGRVINHWSMTENRNLNKHLSFQIYVPSEDYYYIDIRPTSSRHSIQGVSPTGNNINNLSQFTFVTDAEKGRSIIAVKDGVGGSYVTKGIYGLDAWHTVDIYINDKTVAYYVDYEYVSETNIIATGVYADGFDHSFKGLQMCIGEDNRTTGIEEGMYIKNIQLTTSAPELGIPVLTENFENYSLDTDVTDGVDVTDITSGIGKVTRYNQFAAVENTYSETGALGFKQLEDGNKVFVARNVPDHPRVGTGRDMRYGFWRVNAVDLNRGPITIEMDINIPDRSKFEGVIIQPFAQNPANGTLEAEINTGGIRGSALPEEPGIWNNTSTPNARTAYASLLIPCSTNALFNLRMDGQIYYAGDVDLNNNFYHSKPYTQGEWANLKFIISKEGEASYKTKVYINDEFMGEQSTAKTATNALQTAATDMVRGVRLMSAIAGRSTYVEDLYYIDNVKMYLNEGNTVNEYDVNEFRLLDDKGNYIAGEIGDRSSSVEAGWFITKNRNVTTGNARVMLAQYDKDGVLLSCKMEEIDLANAVNGEMLGGKFEQTLASGAKSVKAFMWTNNLMKPIYYKLYDVE